MDQRGRDLDSLRDMSISKDVCLETTLSGIPEPGSLVGWLPARISATLTSSDVLSGLDRLLPFQGDDVSPLSSIRLFSTGPSSRLWGSLER